MDSAALISPDYTRLIWFAIVCAVALIGLSVYRRNRSSLEPNEKPATVGSIVYNDAPTVRVTDSQHFDRLRKVVRLSAGQHTDIVQSHPIVGPRFRITFHGLVMHGASESAHVSIVFHGNQVSCGPLAREVNYNEFYLPRAAREESRSALFYYNESGNALEFMRIKVNDIDTEKKTAEIEAMQMRGNWPGSEA
jgi:hypothetical protein